MDAEPTTRRATAADAVELASLLHDFNTEFDVESPGIAFLANRLRTLLAGDRTVAFLVHASRDDTAALGLALLTLRPNVWYEGQVALLDELYVVPDRRGRGLGSALIAHLLTWARGGGIDVIEINVDEPDVDAQRFYERHGFSGVDVATGERAFYYAMELTD